MAVEAVSSVGYLLQTLGFHSKLQRHLTFRVQSMPAIFLATLMGDTLYEEEGMVTEASQGAGLYRQLEMPETALTRGRQHARIRPHIRGIIEAVRFAIACTELSASLHLNLFQASPKLDAPADDRIS